MNKWCTTIFGMLLGLTGFCGTSGEQFQVRMDEQGRVAAALGDTPLVQALHVRHSGIPRERWHRPEIVEKDGKWTAKVKGASGASAEWAVHSDDGAILVTVVLDARKDEKAQYPIMDAKLVLAKDLFAGRRYALWGEAMHQGSGAKAPYSAAGTYPVSHTAASQNQFSVMPYGGRAERCEFYGDSDIIEVRVSPGGRCGRQPDGWSVRAGTRGPVTVELALRAHTYEAFAEKILARPGVLARDPTTPPTPNLSECDNGFETPFTRKTPSGSLPSRQWGLSLHGNSEARVERTARDAHSGAASLRWVKKNQLGHVQLYHIRNVAKTPVAERDGVRYLLRYWGRVRNTGLLKGGVFLYAVEGQGRGQSYGPPLSFDLPTGPSDMTPWTRKDHIYTLRKGEYIDRVIFTFTGHTGDEALIDDIALHRLPDDFRILDEIDIVRSSWPVVPERAVSFLPRKIRDPGKAGNLLQNSSFEAGADRLVRGGYYCWYKKNQYQIDRSTAFHGRASLRLQQGVGRTCRTKVYRVVPGKLHTFSFYAKADRSAMYVYAEILSGLQADHSGERIGWIARPGVRRNFRLAKEWRRHAVSFIPVTRLLPTAYIQLSPKGSREGRVWVDALCLEQGPSTPFATDTKLQVADRVALPDPGELDCTAFAGWIETHRQPLPPGKKWMLEMPPILIFGPKERVPLRATVFTDVPRRAELRWEFVDYYGRVARTVNRSVETGASCMAEDRFALSGFDLGRYVIRLKASAHGCETAVAEETSFTILPKALDDPNLQTDFGFTGWVPSWVYWHRRLGFHAIRSLDSMTLWPYTWGRCESEKGRYTFYEGTYHWLEERGIATLVCLCANLGPSYAYGKNIPEWAQVHRDAFPKGTAQHSFGFDPDQYLSFVAGLAEHWRGRIKAYEIWNEPYGQRDSAQPTGELGRKIAQTIRQADPDAKIYGPCSYWGSGTVKWTETAMSHLKTDVLDGFCYHGYPTRLHEEEGWGWTAALGRFNRIMDASGGRRPMMDTEMQASKSWLWSDRSPGTGNLTYLPQPTAMDGDTFWPKVVGQYYIIARALGTRFFWTYQAWEPGYGTHDDLTPGNALLATAVNGWLMGGSEFLEQIDLGQKVRCYLFQTRDGKLLAAGFGMFMEKPGTIAWPLPRETKIHGVVGTSLWPGGGSEPLARWVDERIEMQLSRDPFYILPPLEMSRDAFAASLRRAEICGVELMSCHPFVINLADGRPGLAVAVQNLSPGHDLTVTVEAQAPTGSGWQLARDSASKGVPAKSEAKLSLPFASTPAEPGEPVKIRTVTTAEGTVRTVESVVRVLGVAKARARVALDGDLRDWQEVPPTVRLDRQEQINDQKAGTRWAGPNDLSMAMRLAWDEQHLYVAAEVRDDTFVMDRKEKTDPLAYWYAADCVEVFLDTSNTASLDRRTATDSKYHLYFIAGRGDSRAADWMCELSDPPMKEVWVASRFGPDGYVVEAAIPLSAFPAVKVGKPGTVIRFFTAVNDRDEPGGTHSLRKTGMLWYKTERWWENSLDYASLVFLP